MCGVNDFSLDDKMPMNRMNKKYKKKNPMNSFQEFRNLATYEEKEDIEVKLLFAYLQSRIILTEFIDSLKQMQTNISCNYF